ncbi:MAG: hypothetical protein NVV82_00370 [Sporocytophaga sp.]|nr:hypothetical protein [Sporocytophaga sp.]
MVEFFDEEHVRAFIRFKAEMTVSKAIEQGNSIRTCYNKHSEETVEVVSYLLIDFAQSINVGKNISEAQVDEIAYMICTHFSDLTIEELIVVFSNAKAGRYGQQSRLYDRIDVIVISEFISAYYEQQRSPYLEKANSYKNFQSNDILDAVMNSEKPENPQIRKAKVSLKRLQKQKKPETRTFTATAVIPKSTEYLEKAKKLMPEFGLKDIQLFRRHAVQANWEDLIQLIDEEIGKREKQENSGKGQNPEKQEKKLKSEKQEKHANYHIRQPEINTGTKTCYYHNHHFIHD